MFGLRACASVERFVRIFSRFVYEKEPVASYHYEYSDVFCDLLFGLCLYPVRIVEEAIKLAAPSFFVIPEM